MKKEKLYVNFKEDQSITVFRIKEDEKEVGEQLIAEKIYEQNSNRTR